MEDIKVSAVVGNQDLILLNVFSEILQALPMDMSKCRLAS